MRSLVEVAAVDGVLLIPRDCRVRPIAFGAGFALEDRAGIGVVLVSPSLSLMGLILRERGLAVESGVVG